MLHLEELSKTDNGIQWRTDLMAHVLQEAVLGILHLLCLEGLLFQLLLIIHLFRHVTAQSEIVFYLPCFVVGRNQVEAQVHQFVVMDVDTGQYVSINRFGYMVVHVVQQVHRLPSVFVVDQCHAACLGNLILYLVDTAIDNQGMRLGGIGDHVHTARL